MTRNERIAEVMRWTKDINNDPDGSHLIHILENIDSQTSGNVWCLVKELQKKMVDDRWIVHIIHYPTERFYGSARKSVEGKCSYTISEPAAIVELFCKVYNITEE